MKTIKALIVEDDFVSGKVMQKMIAPIGKTEIASDGKKGVAMFEKALNEKEPYNIVFLDIMMPEMDGYEVLKNIRTIEEKNGILEGVSVVITSALGDFLNIKEAYREQCEFYLIKPIDKAKVMEVLKKIGVKS